MYYNLICIVILSFCVQSFLITDATKNILTQEENEISFKLSDANTDEAGVEAENKLNQQAVDCDCGVNSIDCKIIDEKKICYCKEGYAQGNDIYHGICVDTCNETQKCENGGSCLKHLCVCLPGTFGVFCEKIHDCLFTDMCRKDEYTFCSYDVERKKAYCRCYVMEWKFDEATKTCKRCLCQNWDAWDLRSFSWCEYQQGRKMCVCTEGYAYNPGYEACQTCDCGAKSTYCGFDNKGKKICSCLEGFSFDGYQCSECRCGDHGICNQRGDCICDEGYTESRRVCVECSCGKYGTCLFDGNNTQIGCECEKGYAVKLGKCEKCYCGDNINCTFDGVKKVCGCKPGYKNANGFCTDINECEKQNPCKESMACVNLLGSYDCICKDGYKPSIVDTSNEPHEICQDIDECENSSSCAQPNTFCENTIGSYKCICESGFVSRGLVDSLILCEKSTASEIYTTVVIASFVSLIVTGTVVYYLKKRFR